MEQYNHAEKLKNQFSASLVNIYDCKKQNGARNSWKVMISYWSKSSNTSIQRFRESLAMYENIFKIF